VVGGRYLLVDQVGQGGMGRVWRGRDQLLDRVVAVKEVVLPSQSPQAHAELVARTMREARIVARLSHPGVVTVHDVVEHDGTPWIVMQFVSGPSLGTEISRTQRLPWQRVAEIGVQVADALAHAHAEGIVHRDLKPDNILLTGSRAIVTDFGIARIADATTRLTSSGVVVGTVPYMAPEQLDGGSGEPSVDMWALGATLYTAVEGCRPFDAPTLTSLMAAILTGSYAPPGHAGPLRELIEGLLVKDPGSRPDAQAAARALAGIGFASGRARLLVTGNGDSAAGGTAELAGQPPPTLLDEATDPVHTDTATTELPDPSPGTGAPVPDGGHVRRGARRRAALPAAARSRPGLALAAGGAAVVVAVLAVVLPLELLSGPGPSRGPSASDSSSSPPSSPSASASGSSPPPSSAVSLPANPASGFALSGKQIAVRGDPSGYGSQDVAFSPNGNSIVGTFENGNGLNAGHVDFWSTASGKLTRTLTDPAGGNYLEGLAFSPKNADSLAVADQNGVDLWNLAAGTVRTYADPDGGIVADVAYLPDGKTVAAADDDGDVYLLNVASGMWAPAFYRDSAAYDSQGGSNPTLMYQVAVSPNGKLLVAADSAGNVYVWNLSGGSPVVLTGASSSQIQTVAFSPNGETLAVSYPNSVRLWDVASRTFYATLTVPGLSTQAIAFSPNGGTLAVYSINGPVYLWDLATRHETSIAASMINVDSIAFSPDGRTLAVAVFNQPQVYLYSVKYSGS